MKVRRPALRYYGGKWKLAPWIVGHFPKHRVYTEPFGGAASVLLQKPRAYAEIYNDLHDEIVNVFRVLRDPAKAERLRELLHLTPYSRVELLNTHKLTDDDIENARRIIVRSQMGFSSDSVTRGWQAGFRKRSNRSGTTPAKDWSHYPDIVPALCERMRGVVIEHCDAKQCILDHDSLETLHYVDPPYPLSTRSEGRKRYRHELTETEHSELASLLQAVKGMVVLSGYRCPLYDDLYATWTRFDCETYADGARPRDESVWLSPRAYERLQPRLAI